MRVLLDNCVPRKFGRLLLGFDVVGARQMGWHELSNGKLLAAAEGEGFLAFITTDKHLQFQQNIGGRKIGIILLATRLVYYEELVPLTDRVLLELSRIKPGSLVILASTDFSK